MFLRLDWAKHDSVRFACENYHYSKSVPTPPLVKIGVWENKIFIGVICFSRGASSSLFSPYGLKQTEGCELTRIALKKHQSPVSKIVKIAIKMLKKKCPKIRLIISFADPNQGHNGSIYQAGNWIYSGRTAESFKYVDSVGRTWHSRQVSEKGFNIQYGLKRLCPRPSECQKIKELGKHRYLMPLDGETKLKIIKFSKPYPKRVASKDVVASGFQSEEGSSILTATLHKDLSCDQLTVL